MPQLVATCLDMSTWDAIQFINERFNIEQRTIRKTKQFREYGDIDVPPNRFTLPLIKIAPFKSGKATHKYFFKRGFTEQTVKDFLIGWDRQKKRITLPVFYQDGILAGIIGRAVYELDTEQYEDLYGEEPKYLIYEHFPIGDVLIGAHMFSGSKTAILVEGSFDFLWMQQLGFPNTLSTIISNFTEKQRDILFSLGVEEVVLFYDNDAAGRKACVRAYELLKPFFKVYTVTYPVLLDEEGEEHEINDPMGLSKEQIQYMLDNKRFYWKKNLVKI